MNLAAVIYVSSAGSSCVFAATDCFSVDIKSCRIPRDILRTKSHSKEALHKEHARFAWQDFIALNKSSDDSVAIS